MTASAERLATWYSRHSFDEDARVAHPGRTRTDFVQSDGIAPLTMGWPGRLNVPTHPVTGCTGMVLMLTDQGLRVYGELVKVASIAGGVGYGTQGELAERCGVARSTVHRIIKRLIAFEVFDVFSWRGGGGGYRVTIRQQGDRWAALARQARQWLSRSWQKRQARLQARLEASGYPFGVNVATESVQVGGRHQPVGVGGSTRSLHSTSERDQAIADALGIDPGKARGRVVCPIHGDRTPNLAWAWGRERLVLTCWSHHCSHADIVAALGIR